jgi:hypothetical protein
MPSSVLMPLIVFFALAVPICLLLWRVFWVGGELRRDAARGRAAVDLAHRADVSLAELAELVDDLRRHKAKPEDVADGISAAADSLVVYARDAEEVDKHVAGEDGAPALAPEVERAQRAVALIEHGRELMVDPHGEGYGEGESSVKRGYLNLLHARDAINATAREIAEALSRPPAPAPGRRGNRE